MNLRDIETVAYGLREARPGSYPGGLPDTTEGWRAWYTVCHEVGKALAVVTREWRAQVWDDLLEKDQ